MAFPVGELNYRYILQAPTEGTFTDSGDAPRTWATEATLWGGRMKDSMPGETAYGARVAAIGTELVRMRFRAGVNEQKRFLRARETSTLSASVNASVTTIPMTDALKYNNDDADYILVENEVMKVLAGTTSLTVERGALGTTAATHSISTAAKRVELLEIVGVERADEREDEMIVRVKHVG